MAAPPSAGRPLASLLPYIDPAPALEGMAPHQAAYTAAIGHVASAVLQLPGVCPDAVHVVVMAKPETLDRMPEDRARKFVAAWYQPMRETLLAGKADLFWSLLQAALWLKVPLSG